MITPKRDLRHDAAAPGHRLTLINGLASYMTMPKNEGAAQTAHPSHLPKGGGMISESHDDFQKERTGI